MVSPATQAGLILGTAAYMSPEQARGKAVDQRADIWAFGCVLFEMLTGHSPFGAGETVSDSIAAILTREPDWNALPPDTPASVRRLLRRCIEKDVNRRLHHIGDARLELDETSGEPSEGLDWWCCGSLADRAAVGIRGDWVAAAGGAILVWPRSRRSAARPARRSRDSSSPFPANLELYTVGAAQSRCRQTAAGSRLSEC